VSIGIFFQKKVMTALFGGEGFIMQKLEGDGMVFVHAGGTVVERELASRRTHRCRHRLRGGAHRQRRFRREAGRRHQEHALRRRRRVPCHELTGPGHVWLQSLPFSRMAGRMLAAAYQKGGAKDEGSVLGGLGRILDGDNSM
jgi:uncharacterized protein (AIM24 family)